MKAIVSTSANPFHYGHLDIFNKAKQIFDDVHIVIAQNSNKENAKNLEFHLNVYKIPYKIIYGQTVADYCAEHEITHIVRGIRNGVDAEYELKLDFANKEINPNIQTVFIPTSDVYSNISSSTIRELLRYKKFDIVKKYMNEDAMWRYINEKPKYTIYFGKSCVGKSTYLEHKCFNTKIIDVDKYIWQVLEEVKDKQYILSYKEKLRNLVYSEVLSISQKKDIMYTGFQEVLNEEFWDKFFKVLHFSTNCVLDWAAVGMYYELIPIKYRTQCKFIELTCNEEVRKIRILNKNFENKITYLDQFYTKPLIIDKSINISNN